MEGPLMGRVAEVVGEGCLTGTFRVQATAWQRRTTRTTLLSCPFISHWPRSTSQRVWEPVSAVRTCWLLGAQSRVGCGKSGGRFWNSTKMGVLVSRDTEIRAPRNTYLMVRCQSMAQRCGGGILSTVNKNVAWEWMPEMEPCRSPWGLVS